MSATVAAAIAIGIAISQGLASASAAHQQGKAQASYYDFLAKQSQLKSGLQNIETEQQAKAAQDEGAYLSKKLNSDIRQLEASQDSAMIYSGISLDSVTAEDIANDTLNKRNLDEMLIRYNADLKEWQTRREGIYQNIQTAAEVTGFQQSGIMAQQAGKYRAQSSVIGGIGSGLNTYLIYKGGGSDPDSKK